jgi:hypothetical protein
MNENQFNERHNVHELKTWVASAVAAGRTPKSKDLIFSYKGGVDKSRNITQFLYTMLTERTVTVGECKEWIPFLLVEGNVAKYQETFGLLAKTMGVCGKTWVPGQVAFKCRTCEKDPTW